VYCSFANSPKCGQQFGWEMDLAGFAKNGQMPDLPQPGPKAGTSLTNINYKIRIYKVHTAISRETGSGV